MDSSLFLRISVRISVLWMLLFLVIQTEAQQFIDCQKTGPCSCTSGSGTIDLSQLDSKNPTQPSFQASGQTFPDETYYYNPCSPFSLTDIECQNAAVCKQNGTTYSLLGTQDTVQFIQDQTLGLQIVYTAVQGPIVSSVQLLCDLAAAEPVLTVTGEDPLNPGKYLMSLKSAHACPISSEDDGGGLSTGSILCILFVVSVVVYLVTGAIVNKFVVGATGVEIIPQLYIWKEFPLLVKDGVVFFITFCMNGCRVKDVTYDSI